jgi:hypothetical protein
MLQRNPFGHFFAAIAQEARRAHWGQIMVPKACVASPESTSAPSPCEPPDFPAVPPRVPSVMPEQDLTIWTPFQMVQALLRVLTPEREPEPLPIKVRTIDRV